MKFPLYRKYVNSRNYFKIISMGSFEEVQLVGNRRFYRVHEVKLYPDRLLFNELMEMPEGRIVEAEAPEYERMRADAEPL